MSKKKNSNAFLYQGMILAVAGFITKIIGVAYRIPLTNILGDDGMGYYGYAFEIYSIALLLSSFSLPLVVSKLVSLRIAKKEYRNAVRVFSCAMGIAVIMGLAVSLIVGFGAGFFATNVMKSSFSAYALRVLAPGLFIVSIMGVVRGYFQGLGTMVPTAVSQVIEQLMNAIVSIIAASYLLHVGEQIAGRRGNDLFGPAYGAAGGTLGTVLGALAGAVFLFLVLFAYRKVIRKQVAADRTRETESVAKITRIVLLTMAPVVLSTSIYNINQILDLGLFSNIMAAQGYDEQTYMALQGIFTGKYNTLISVPLVLANAFASSAIPSLTTAISRGDKELTLQRIHLTIRFTMITAIPCMIGYMVLSSPIMQLLYRDDSLTPALMLSIGSVSILFSGWSTVANGILQGLNHMRDPVKNGAISLVVHLISVVIMLVFFQWGIYSLAVGNIVFSVCMSWLNARCINKACGYKQEKDKTFLRPLTAAVIMGVVTYAVYLIMNQLFGNSLATILSILVAAAVYVVAILKLGGLTEEELLEMPRGAVIVRICKKLHLLNSGIF